MSGAEKLRAKWLDSTLRMPIPAHTGLEVDGIAVSAEPALLAFFAAI